MGHEAVGHEAVDPKGQGFDDVAYWFVQLLERHSGEEQGNGASDMPRGSLGRHVYRESARNARYRFL